MCVLFPYHSSLYFFSTDFILPPNFIPPCLFILLLIYLSLYLGHVGDLGSGPVPGVHEDGVVRLLAPLTRVKR